MIPNTGPHKVPGVYDPYDQVRLISPDADPRMAYMIVGPVSDRPDLIRIIRECHCGGVIKVPRSAIQHLWHYLND